MHEKKSIDSMNFEESLQELELIIRRLESGQENLDSAIASFERAAELKKHCENKLNFAKIRIEQIVKDSDNNITTVVSSIGE